MKITRLCKRREFELIYQKGKVYTSYLVVLIVLPNNSSRIRAGFVASKKIGKAVKRNRARRLLKEAYRKIFPRLNLGYDFLILARKKTPAKKMDEVYRCLFGLLKQAKVLSE